MEDDLDINVIRNTQLSLGKYVKRPPLSDKLLRKPPFRFLHDIVISVLKSKGFFEGLFEETELISENVKDRESKITFLNKVISVVSLTTGKQLTVKPSKIVAGQEPEKTNELLQLLAQALDNNLSSGEAVKQFKSGLKIHPNIDKKGKESVKPIKKSSESKKVTSRTSEKLVVSGKDGQSLSKSKSKENTVHKKELPPKKSVSKVTNKKSAEQSSQGGKKNNENEQKSILDRQIISDNLIKHNQQDLVPDEDNVALDEESNTNDKILQPDHSLQKDVPNVATINLEEQLVLDVNESIIKPTPANKSMRINELPENFEINKKDNINDNYSINPGKDEIKNGEENIKQSAQNSEKTVVKEISKKESEETSRVQSANNFDKKDFLRPTSVRPPSSRPGAPRIRDKSENVINDTDSILIGKVNIISENTLHEEEEDTNIIFENEPEDLYEETPKEQNNIVNQNSHLVQQILDSQREFSQTVGKTEIEWQFGAQRAPDIFIQEMEVLKFSVQALSRIANPLGKLLDHIQEDVEVMRQELQQWTKLYQDTSKDLLLQKTANNEALLPFHTKLKQLTEDMNERHEKIIELKISIHKNDLRIQKLLTNGNVQ